MPNKCSELAAVIWDVARAHAALNPDATIDTITHDMAVAVPGITRDRVVESIIEATQSNKRAVSDLQKLLARLKREARSDKSLREQIERLETHLAEGTLPDPTTPRKITRTAAVQELTDITNELLHQLSKSEPALRDKYEKQIAAELERLADGTWRNTSPKVDELAGMEENAELQKLRFQRDKLRAQARRELANLDRKHDKNIGMKIVRGLNGFKALQATGEMSVVLNQGLALLSDPPKMWRASRDMVTSFFSEGAAHRQMQELEAQPDFGLWVRTGGLAIQSLDAPLSQLEAELQSVWRDSPLLRRVGIGQGLAAFDRAHVAFLNRARYDLATATAAHAANGVPTADEYRQIAGFVNTLTGRGSLGSAERFSESLNLGLFSPRYTMAKFQMATLQPLWQGEWRGYRDVEGKLQSPWKLRGSSSVRRSIARQMVGRQLGSMATMYLLAGMFMGAEDHEEFWHPLSSGFMKVKVGPQTYLDISGGLAGTINFLARPLTGHTFTRGRPVPLSEAHGDIVVNFIKSKRSSGLGVLWEAASRKDFMGNPQTVAGATLGGMTPITWGEAVEVADDIGTPAALNRIFAMALGARISTWNDAQTSDPKWFETMGLTW